MTTDKFDTGKKHKAAAGALRKYRWLDGQRCLWYAGDGSGEHRVALMRVRAATDPIELEPDVPVGSFYRHTFELASIETGKEHPPMFCESQVGLIVRDQLTLSAEVRLGRQCH